MMPSFKYIAARSLPLFTCLMLVLVFPMAQANAKNVVLVLGDSIGAGYRVQENKDWVALMATELGEREPAYQVINASISGDNSHGALARLPQLLERYKPAVVIVEIGGNDGLRGHPISTLQNNLTKIIYLSQNAGARVLLLGMHIPPNYGQRYADMFHQAFHHVARTTEVPLVPFLLEGVALNDKLMQSDRIHPNTEAQPLILQNVMPTLEEILDEL